MMKRGKKTREYKIFVEVLQNGELLSETSRPFEKPGIIRLTSKSDGELTAPFYPLPTDIDLIKITKRGAEIDLDPNWEGFTTFEGKIENISSDRSTQYTHIMTKGDYGSIAYNDLRVLIRIGYERPKSKRHQAASPTGEYRGKSSKLLIGDAIDFKTLGIGFLASLWLFGIFSFTLLQRHDSSPRSFLDLRPVYTLPFVHPKHLETIPEALQRDLNRSDFIGSTFRYYHNLTSVFMGYGKLTNAPIFKNTRDIYNKTHKDQRTTIRSLLSEQRTLELKVARSEVRSPLIIPTIKGEALDQSLLRIKDKMEIAHKGLEQTLETRRKTSTSFKKDREYRFSQYKAVEGGSTPPPPEEMSREQKQDLKAMYENARSLAISASSQQRRIRKQRIKEQALSMRNVQPIAIAPANTLVSFIDPKAFDGLGEKIHLIRASRFDLRGSGMLREPLLGKVNPELINRTISRNRFQLQLCFELALRRNQALKGTMEWQWRLDTKGKISDIELLGTSIRDRRMIRCIRKRIASWKFPRPRNGSVEIKYPFYFAPQKG